MEQKSGKRKRGGGEREAREEAEGKKLLRQDGHSKDKIFSRFTSRWIRETDKKKFDSRTKADAGNVSGLLAIRFAAF